MRTGGKMPLWCKFNKPTDKTNEEEYVQYIYAMQLWKLQDELGLSFEMASMSLYSYRNRIPEHILRYRSDVNVDDRKQLKNAEAVLWKQYHSLDLHISDWMDKNCERFQGILCISDVCVFCRPGEYILPEFTYY